ncbi:bifunctional hydroxymethylpyrimidine kinase/phosphomethylpyrimidine kinase [Granulicella sp. dw_53]|uniref:bifunctional hydroxymethylpyrimidine kinase/phosphomethylpyrimidine kinase n=1 Tax=Granulicella sp. dw_53 TaxID=2719792 RepID=UPI001BD4ADC9|nr:bifunctional hydroxymethylpyrimidine kinase/phosphomethylpyrimidine kinase [Granulicella sp. dw_53]
MQTVLTIAGFDPSSGAGVTADLMVFAAHGLFGTSAITSLTVQSTQGVRSTHPIAPDVLLATLRCLAEDLPPAGIKIGMLGSAAATMAVIEFVEELRSHLPHIPIVLDPVLRSSSGRELLEPEGVELVRTRLLPLVDWITPNIDELGFLSGLSVVTKAEVPNAAQVLQRLGAALNVLATGGHLTPPDDLLFAVEAEPVWLPGEYIASRSTHGTGCALSSALLSRLVLGDEPYAAALAAKQYVSEAIRTATPRGMGRGPLNHLWPVDFRSLR